MAYIPNPTVPYVGPLHGVSNGLLLQISGQPLPSAKWFAINLQCGPSMNPRDDIALHINPRFEGNTSKILRNSLQSQQWGMEENFGHFPLAPGQPFEILVLVETECFKIAINGQHYTDFRHRTPLMRVNTLSIDGDVIIHCIRFEGGNAGIPPEVQQQATATHLGAPGGGYNRSPSPQRAHVPMPTSGGYQGATAPYPQQGGSYMPQPQATPGAYGFQQQAPAYPQMQQQPYTSYPAQQPYGSSSLHASSAPMAVPGHSPKSDHKYLKYGAVGLGGAVAGAALSRLIYPGHKGYHGHHHGGFGMGHGMMGGYGHGKKMKKMMKHGGGHHYGHHKWHKPKFKHKHHKGWKGSSSSSSSSSEEE